MSIDGGVAFCVVCGRFDRDLVPRKSGLKCADCVGKRSKKEYSTLQAQHATFLLAQSHRAHSASMHAVGSPLAVAAVAAAGSPATGAAAGRSGSPNPQGSPKAAGARGHADPCGGSNSSAAAGRSVGDTGSGSPGSPPKLTTPGPPDGGALYGAEPGSPLGSETSAAAAAIPSVILEAERVAADLDAVTVSVERPETVAVDEYRTLPMVGKIKTQTQLTVYHFIVRRRYCPHETAPNDAGVSYMCAECRKPVCTRRHRFSSALLLFTAIKHVGGDALPELPSKKVFARFNSDFIEVRRREMETFLAAVMQNTFFVRHPQVLAFLGLTEDKTKDNTITTATAGLSSDGAATHGGTVHSLTEDTVLGATGVAAGSSTVGSGVELTSDYMWNWKRGSLLGKGSFGSVYLGLLPNTSQLVAVKVIPVANIAASQLESLQSELSLLRALSHPNIVRLLGAMWDRGANELCMFQEYVECGSVARMIKKFGALPFSVIQRYLHQVTLGVAYLHANNIVHRDIKGDNILVGKDGCVKVADFGCAAQLRSVIGATVGAEGGLASSGDGSPSLDAAGATTAVDAAPQQMGDITGTPLWMSPEAMRGEATVGLPSDIWAVGCVGIEMLKRSIWNVGAKENVFTAMYRIQKSTNLPDGFPKPSEGCPQSFTDMLKACFNRDPAERPTAQELLQHPFFKEDFVEADPDNQSASDDVASLVSGGGVHKRSPRPSIVASAGIAPAVGASSAPAAAASPVGRATASPTAPPDIVVAAPPAAVPAATPRADGALRVPQADAGGGVGAAAGKRSPSPSPINI